MDETYLSSSFRDNHESEEVIFVVAGRTQQLETRFIGKQEEKEN